MCRSLWDAMQEVKKLHGTENNTYDQFTVGTHVKIITPCQDMMFFFGETGVVKKNSGTYLGIIVDFDVPRRFVDGFVQTDFNFEPDDLIEI